MLDEGLTGSSVILVETFDHNNHIFYAVRLDNQLLLKHEGTDSLISKLIIKPDLWAIFTDGTYKQGIELLKPCHSSEKKVLAKNYYIDPEVFGDLVDNNTISYSKGMADLYDFPIEYASDVEFHKRDYKHHKTKELTLNKMRNGQFN